MSRRPGQATFCTKVRQRMCFASMHCRSRWTRSCAPYSNAITSRCGGDRHRRYREGCTAIAETWRSGLQRVAGVPGVLVEHLDRLERVLVEVFSYKRELLQEIRGDGDDVTADLVRLKD